MASSSSTASMRSPRYTGEVASHPVKRRMHTSTLDRVANLAFVLPGIALAALFFLYPTALALVRGFTDWSPGVGGDWVGFANFTALFRDPNFGAVVQNSLIYLLGVPIWVIVPLIVTLMLYDKTPKASWFRVIYLFPLVLTPAILGLVFSAILNPTDGLLNQLLTSVGLHDLTAAWIDSPELVKPSIIMITLWGGLGMTVLILHSALTAVQPELFEAAELDGASWWAKLRYVMLPGIRPVLEAVIALSTVGVFISFFGLISVLTNGGPNYASASIDFDVYARAFTLQNFGGSSAEALVLIVFVILTVLVLLGLRWALNAWSDRPRPLNYATLGDRVRTSRLVNSARPRVRAFTARIRRATPHLKWSPLRLLIAVLLAVVFLYPIIYMAGTAVKTVPDFNDNPIGLPRSFTWSFMSQAWAALGNGQALLNSVIAVGIGVLVCAALSSLTAFWLYLNRGVMRVIVISVIGIFYFVPVAVWIIPLNTMLAQFGLSNNLAVLGVIYGVSQFPFGVALISTYLSRGLNPELLEAARVDGASLFRQYWSIVLPLSGPVLGSVIALAGAFMWGDLIIGLVILQSPDTYPATLAATQIVGRSSPSLQLSAAAATISLIPLLILFAATQRLMVRGITAGSGRL